MYMLLYTTFVNIIQIARDIEKSAVWRISLSHKAPHSIRPDKSELTQGSQS